VTEEYFISEDTLILIPISKNKTKIYDINGIITIKKSAFEIVNESCLYYGSSYSGRCIGAKNMLEMDYKLPIIVDEVKEVIIFPTCSPKLDKCIWICLNNVENYEKNKKNSIVKFINNINCDIDISINTLENQILRATLLMMKLKKRKSTSRKGKKIGK